MWRDRRKDRDGKTEMERQRLKDMRWRKTYIYREKMETDRHRDRQMVRDRKGEADVGIERQNN